MRLSQARLLFLAVSMNAAHLLHPPARKGQRFKVRILREKACFEL
jgi:hypothetical protein